MEVLKENPEKIDMKFLERFPEYIAFKKLRHEKEEKGEEKEAKTPEDILAENYLMLRADLAHELLEKIRNNSSEFFEKLVVHLLVEMGYGGSRLDAGQAVGKTGDDGIDGIIKEDKLGLDIVAIQAKKWKNPVGRPDIQGFVGSLVGNRAKKGVFITTSSFSKDALEYVNRIEQKVVLIDGDQLAELMMDHNIGVYEDTSYSVKKVDQDYFEEE
jgi:restriction system protein